MGMNPFGKGDVLAMCSNVCSSYCVVTGQPAALYIAYLLTSQAKVRTIRGLATSLHSQAQCDLPRSGARLS